MKRASLLLALCLLLPCLLCLNVQGAAKGKMTLSGAPAGLSRGSELAVTVALNRNPGVHLLRAAVSYDPAVLVFDRAEDAGILPGFSFDQKQGEVLLRWQAENGNFTQTGNAARLVFFVKSDAIYGDSALSLRISEKLFDATDVTGEAIPFDTDSLPFSLACPHEREEKTVLEEASFETEGSVATRCPDCGRETELILMPVMQSEDGSLEATLNTGEYRNSDEKALLIRYLFGGDEADRAKALFGDSVIRAFRIRFTKNEADFIPASPCKIRLTPQFDLPENFALYAVADGNAELLWVKGNGEAPEFDYSDRIYVLVERSAEAEPEIPEATTTTTTAPPTTTKDPVEQARKQDQILIVAGIVVFVLCGLGMILLASGRKRY